MSILSALAFVTALVVKPFVRIEPDPRDAEIIALKAKVDDLLRENADWRCMAEAYRERLLRTPEARKQIERAKQAQAQMLEVYQQICNCVPSRAQVWFGQRV